MTRRRRHLATILAAALAGACVVPALGQQRQEDQNRSGPRQQQQPPPRPAAPIPQDSRVPLPSDSRAPLGGSGRLQGLPPAQDRLRQGPVDPPRPPVDRTRPGGQPQDLQGSIDHARQLEQDARRRYGLPSGGGSGRPNPWTGERSRVDPGGYRDYWGNGYPYRRYYDRPYYDRPYDRPYPGEWPEDVGPADVGPPVVGPPVGPREAGPRQAGEGGAAADGPERLPDLPPDELLGEEELSPALRKALAASPEWKRATADLIRAWGAYADAVDGVLGDLQDQEDYRRARTELRRATARLQAARAASEPARADARPDAAAPDRLLAATDAALKARHSIRRLESAALAADPGVQRAEKRLDTIVKGRVAIVEKVAATLPEADRPAAPARPKLLEEEQE